MLDECLTAFLMSGWYVSYHLVRTDPKASVSFSACYCASGWINSQPANREELTAMTAKLHFWICTWDPLGLGLAALSSTTNTVISLISVGERLWILTRISSDITVMVWNIHKHEKRAEYHLILFEQEQKQCFFNDMNSPSSSLSVCRHSFHGSCKEKTLLFSSRSAW